MARLVARSRRGRQIAHAMLIATGLSSCESTEAGNWKSWEEAKAGLIGMDYNRLIDCAGPPLSERATTGNSGNIQYIGQYANDIASSTCRLSIDVTGGKVAKINEYVELNGMPSSAKSMRYTCTRIVQFCSPAPR
jgi:hypothetical protein